MPKLKIAVIGLKGLPAFGGASSVGECLLEEMKEEFDFTVYSVSSHTNEKSGTYKDYKQIVFHGIGKGGLNTLVYYIKCLFHCLFKRYDIIHLHHSESGFITPFLKLKYKVIVTFHGVYRDEYIDPKFSKLVNWFFKLSQFLNVKLAETVVSVSLPDKEYLSKKYNRNCLYIPNGITPMTSDKELKSDSEDYILFAAARIYQIKGLHLLLIAMREKRITLKLKIAGDISQVGEYTKEIERLGSGLNIEYLGLIKDKSVLMKLVRDAKCFVFPSLTEAMSMMLLEVASVKTPIIASDIPSNKAVFSNDEVTFFESNDSESLATRINYVLQHYDDALVKAEKAFYKLSDNYTWQKISSQYREQYNKLIN